MTLKGLLFRCAVRLLGALGIHWPLVWVLSRVMEEVNGAHEPVARASGRSSRKLTLLALQPERFWGDLEILASTGAFRVLRVPFHWQMRLVCCFRQTGTPFPEYYNAPAGSETGKRQEKLHRFLRGFLPALYRRLGIDAVIGAALHYRQDYDWGTVSDLVGVPYIVIHRENLVTGPGQRNRILEIGSIMRRFRGSHIIVYNTLMRDLYIESGYVTPDKISSLGCLRMDRFMGQARKAKSASNQRKKVVLFSFTHGYGLLGFGSHWFDDGETGWSRLFEHVHVTVARLAVSHPDVDFVIKAKWGGSWLEHIDRALRSNGINVAEVDNLAVTAEETDAQELILQSDVVCGFGSTSVLEAAIAGIPTIIPIFDEALKPEYQDFVQFKEYFHLFDVAHSAEEFARLVVRRLRDPEIDAACLAGRYALFEKYISTMNADALDMYTKTIQQVVSERRAVVSP